MELAFDTKYIRRICEDEDKAEEEFGPEIAEKLKHRLSDMRAATVVTELPPTGNLDEVKGNPHSYLRIKLCNGYYLSFSSNHVNSPLKDNGNIDWSKVNHVKILEITKINEN